MKKSLRKLAIMTLAVITVVSLFGTTAQAKKKKKTKTKAKVVYQKPSIEIPDDLYLKKGSRIDLKAKNFTWLSCKVKNIDYQDCEGYISISKKGILTVNKTPEVQRNFDLDIEGGNKKYKLNNTWITIHLYPEDYVITHPYGISNADGEGLENEPKLPYTVKLKGYNDFYNAAYYKIKNDNNYPISVDIEWQIKNKAGELIKKGEQGYCSNATIIGTLAGNEFDVYIMPGETYTIPIIMDKKETDYMNWDYSMRVIDYKIPFVYWKPKTFSCGTVTSQKLRRGRIEFLLPFEVSEQNPNRNDSMARVSFVKNGEEIGSLTTYIKENRTVSLRDEYGIDKHLRPDIDNVIVKPTVTAVETFRKVRY
ncbi:hypothetical protein SAMN05216391_1086 [Lachnospiraceae bacterium KHCPX20]|nr:hypothetical protein SAMN05216391_1086 [Lachnospiraceae bacterium KHCPX20]